MAKLTYQANYTSQGILFIVCIVSIIIFYLRKRRVGVIIGTASLPKIRYFFVILALYILYTGIKGLYYAIHYQGFISKSLLYMISSTFLVTSCLLIIFFISKVHIGRKGVSVPTFPFFIPQYQIRDYNVFSNTLVIKRKEKKDYKIQIDANDVKKIESAIMQMKI